jgi:hypothetical protein
MLCGIKKIDGSQSIFLNFLLSSKGTCCISGENKVKNDAEAFWKTKCPQERFFQNALLLSYTLYALHQLN